MGSSLNRTQFRYAKEIEVKELFAKVTFGASGAPTIDAKNSKGISSIVRSSAGKYVVTFGTPASTQAANTEAYYKLLMAEYLFQNATAPASPQMYLVANAVQTGSVTIQFNAAGTATDPASGEVVFLQFVLGDSNT